MKNKKLLLILCVLLFFVSGCDYIEQFREDFCKQCMDNGFYPEDNDECSERCECLERREYNITDYQQTCLLYTNKSYKGMYATELINSTCQNTTKYYDLSYGACLKTIEK